MLLRFGVENYYSLHERQELSFVAADLNEDENNVDLIPCENMHGITNGLIPSAVIYGANASGKTNLLIALHFMRNAILRSHNQWQAGSGIPYKPFALDQISQSRPSKFDIDFLIGEDLYHYSFESTDKVFVSESLDKGSLQLFSRNENGIVTYDQLEGDEGYKKNIVAAMRPNSLFLSSAIQNNHPTLSIIASFFKGLLFEESEPIAHRNLHDSSQEARDWTVAFLNRVDVGVDGINIEPEGFVSRLNDLDKEIVIRLMHRRRDGGSVPFNLRDESKGTNNLLHSLILIWRALDTGTVLVMDDFGAFVHTQASEAILALFSSKETNPKHAQLIVATHDACLLASPYLRKDQVWFAEKDRGGATSIYPLTEYKTSPDYNIKDGYLQGRFGAIPFAGSIENLIEGL